MALHWSIQKVSSYHELTEDDVERRITEGICWASMIYGLGMISADNLDEWLFRQEFVLITENRAPICKWPVGVAPEPGPVPPMRIIRAQYERRIGFETNVTTVSRKSWLRSRLEKLAADAAANVRKLGLNIKPSGDEPSERDELEGENPPDRFLNYYRCPIEDGGCGHQWTDTSSYTNNDHCPVCDLGDLEPFKSEDL